MTLRELSTELEKLETRLQELRRSEYDIPGEVPFVAAMRQHIVTSLGDIRDQLDGIVTSLDQVNDVDQIMGIRQRIMAKVRKAIGQGDINAEE